MRSRLFSFLVLPSALLLTAFTPFAHAAQNVQNRITSAVNSGSRAPLTGTVSSRAKHSVDLGLASADRKLDSLSLRFSMTPAQQADLNQLLTAQLDPSSPSYHHWLTPEQYGARFGLSSSDIAKVSSWLTSQGFTVTGTARSSTFITFSGSVAQVQQAFSVPIHAMSFNGEQHISNLTDPTVPSAVAGVVLSITGLNDFRPRAHSRPRNVSLESVQPAFNPTSCPSGTTGCHNIVPGDIYTIYDFTPLLSSGITGAGVTIAVVGQSDLTQGSVLPDANITAFRTAAGLPAINLSLQLAGTDPGVSSGDVDEAHLDVEWSSAAAPGAKILYVYGRDVFANSLTQAVDNNVAPILTSSYGLCEAEFNTELSASGVSLLVVYNQLLAQANAQGMTVMSSSGDAGAADCDTSGIASQGLNVDFPTSSPFVTSAGGTMFSGDTSNPSAFWNSANGTTSIPNVGSVTSSVIKYIPEQPWNETNSSTGLDAGGGGGGGASAFFSKPSWQVGPGVPNDSSRDVPDVSFNAAAIHDGYVVCSQNSCSNGFLGANGQANVFGGTSFVAPILAGTLALIEQKLGNTTGLGNINPTLYGLANGPTSATIFHDVITGNNSIECSQGTPNCFNGGVLGFNAGTGYDQASGLGTLDVTNLANGWATATPTGTGGSNNGGCSPTSPATGTSSCVTVTTLKTTSALCAISSASQPFVLSVTVAGTISGTVPTGTVQFFSDTTALGTATLANGAATFTIPVSTAAISSGGHNLSAVYSGDGNYAGSKGTLLASDGSLASVDFSTAQKDFSLTAASSACSASITVNPGATSTGIVFTVTPINGFTGAVTMTAVNNNLGAFTPSFSVTPVNVTSGAVTTSFVVKASVTTAQLIRPGVGPLHQQRPGKAPWYAAGSGATLACMLLLLRPRRRRWGALLAAVLSVAVLTAVGCGGNTSNSGGGGGGGNTSPITNAKPGTYTFTITAVSGTLVHSTQVTVNVP